MVLNWAKIIGNAIVGFSSAALAVVIVGAEPQAIAAGLLGAALQGLLALGAALQDEGKNSTQPISRLNNLTLL